MPCYFPLQAYQHADGEVVFQERARDRAKGANGPVRSLQLPCGQCVGCRLERSRQWAIRCIHEASLYDRNVFVTLTYDEANLPAGASLEYRDFQLFLKRLRRRFKHDRIRFYMCGEYGEDFGRPHFHALLFNFDFPDKVRLWRATDGPLLYRSAELDRLWGHGYTSIGAVNFESAAYVARYVMKKVTGDLAKCHYESVDSEGEIHQRVPEFNHMSLKPGIGMPWLEKFKSDVYPDGTVIIRGGMKCKPPKFYDRKFAEWEPLLLEDLEFKRHKEAVARAADNTPARLAVKEQVARARVRSLKRSLS